MSREVGSTSAWRRRVALLGVGAEGGDEEALPSTRGVENLASVVGHGRGDGEGEGAPSSRRRARGGTSWPRHRSLSQTLVAQLRAGISGKERAPKAPRTYRASSGLARSTPSSSTRLSCTANELAESRA